MTPKEILQEVHRLIHKLLEEDGRKNKDDAEIRRKGERMVHDLQEYINDELDE